MHNIFLAIIPRTWILESKIYKYKYLIGIYKGKIKPGMFSVWKYFLFIKIPRWLLSSKVENLKIVITRSVASEGEEAVN